LLALTSMPWLAVWFRIWRLVVLRDGAGRIYVRWGEQRARLLTGRRRTSF